MAATTTPNPFFLSSSLSFITHKSSLSFSLSFIMEDQNTMLLQNLIDVADEISKSPTSNQLDRRGKDSLEEKEVWVCGFWNREEERLPWESVKKKKREKRFWLCVVSFLVLVAKCLRGMSRLEGVKLSFTPNPYWICSLTWILDTNRPIINFHI